MTGDQAARQVKEALAGLPDAVFDAAADELVEALTDALIGALPAYRTRLGLPADAGSDEQFRMDYRAAVRGVYVDLWIGITARMSAGHEAAKARIAELEALGGAR